MSVAQQQVVPRLVVDAYVKVFEGFPVPFANSVSVTDPADIRRLLENGQWGPEHLRSNVCKRELAGGDDQFITGRQKLVVPSACGQVTALLANRPNAVVTQWSFKLPGTGRRLCQVTVVSTKSGAPEVLLLPCSRLPENLLVLPAVAGKALEMVGPFFTWLDTDGVGTGVTRQFHQALSELSGASSAVLQLGFGNGTAPDREAICREIEIVTAADNALNVIAPAYA